MGLTIKFRKQHEPDLTHTPVEKPNDYTIFDALKQFQDGKIGTLMLVHRETGQAFQVMDHNPKTKRTTLKTSDKVRLTPMLTEREAKIYRPMWR